MNITKLITIILSILLTTGCQRTENSSYFKVTPLGNYWQIWNETGYGKTWASEGDIYVYVYGVPDGLEDSNTCNNSVGGGENRFSIALGRGNWETRNTKRYHFYNGNVYFIKNGVKYNAKPQDKVQTYTFGNDEDGYEGKGKFFFTSPLSCAEYNDAKLYIGGITKDGIKLPPVYFTINYKTQTTSNRIFDSVLGKW